MWEFVLAIHLRSTCTSRFMNEEQCLFIKPLLKPNDLSKNVRVVKNICFKIYDKKRYPDILMFSFKLLKLSLILKEK